MPSIVLPTFSGSTSNAAVIFSLSPLPLKYLVRLAQMAHAQSTAMFAGEGAVEDVKRLMYSISTLHVIASSS